MSIAELLEAIDAAKSVGPKKKLKAEQAPPQESSKPRPTFKSAVRRVGSEFGQQIFLGSPPRRPHSLL